MHIAEIKKGSCQGMLGWRRMDFIFCEKIWDRGSYRVGMAVGKLQKVVVNDEKDIIS